jgi:uncharacterized protein
LRQEVLTWNDVEKLIDHLIPQFNIEFDAMLLVARGGIVPGGMLAEALNLSPVFVASVSFPAELLEDEHHEKSRWTAWPRFFEFPEDRQLVDKDILIVDDVWGTGRSIVAVKNRVASAGGNSYTCVLHFNPYRNLFESIRPDFYAAVTDAHIVYPWEIFRGPERTFLKSI